MRRAIAVAGTMLLLSGCGGGAGSGNDNNNDNGGVSAAVAACQRYVDHIESLTCRDPGFPITNCDAVDLLPAEQVPDYDCLIENLSCTPEGKLDSSGTATCF